MAISKTKRDKVRLMFGGHCAYCGTKKQPNKLQVDHVHPQYWFDKTRVNRDTGGIVTTGNSKDDLSNLMPACQRCNSWKSTFSVEEFREQVGLVIRRLTKHNSQYRLARDFGLVKETGRRVVFYFEQNLIN